MKRRDFLVKTTVALTSAIPLISRGQERPCPPPAMQVSGGTSVVTACSTPVDAGAPSWLDGRGVHEWFQIPGTKLSSCPPTGSPFNGISGPSSKISAWCGATLRRSGSIYMLGGAGGHGDYGGNEVNALDLRAENPAWVELRQSSPSSQAVNSAGVYLDYRAAARHTYWTTQFIHSEDRMVLLPKADPMNSQSLSGATSANSGHLSAYPGGRVMPSFFAADWRAANAGNDWDASSTLRYAFLPSGYSGSSYQLGCSNPQTDALYCGASGRLFRFTPNGGAGTWTNLAALNRDGCASAVDYTRNRLLICGSYSGSEGPEVRSGTSGVVLPVAFGGMGADALKMSGYPGAVYDETNDRFLVFKNSSPMTVYEVDAETWTVSVIATSGSRPAARPQGVHNSVQYVPELKGIVMGHSYSSDVYFMRVA